jgi:hypothetical protein
VERDVEGEERVDMVQLQRGMGAGSPSRKNEESDIV